MSTDRAQHSDFPLSGPTPTLMKRSFEKWAEYAGYQSYKREINDMAKSYYDHVLIRRYFQILVENTRQNIACYRLGWTLRNCIAAHYHEFFENVNKFSESIKQYQDYPSPLKLQTEFGTPEILEEDSYWEDSDNFERAKVDSLSSSLKSAINRSSYEAFENLKMSIGSQAMPLSEIQTNSIPTQQSEQMPYYTSEHAWEVQKKSENLCKRVNALMQKISQRKSSIATPSMDESGSVRATSPRLNLKIPRLFEEGSPLSSISLGEIETERVKPDPNQLKSEAIKEQIKDIEDSELLCTYWKALKAYMHKLKLKRYRITLAQKHNSLHLLHKTFEILWRTSGKKRYAKNKAHLARGSYAIKILQKTFDSICEYAIEMRKKNNAIRHYNRRIARIALVNLQQATQKVCQTRFTAEDLNDKLSNSTKIKFFWILRIQTSILRRHRLQKENANIFYRNGLLQKGLTGMVQGTVIIRKQRFMKAKSILYRQRHLMSKFL